MKKVLKEYTVFDYEELSESAKEKAKYHYLETMRLAEWFGGDWKHNLESIFPDSDLDLWFSLAYCQGDGVNIYGKLAYSDLLLRLDLTEDEKALLNDPELAGRFITLPENRRYSYSLLNADDIAEEIAYEMDIDTYYHTIPAEISSIAKKAYDLLSSLENEIEKAGYEWFYEVSDEEMIQESAELERVYLEDGSLFH